MEGRLARRATTRRLAWAAAIIIAVSLAVPLSNVSAIAIPRTDAPPSLVRTDVYDGPGGIDGPGEVLCNIAPRRLPLLRENTSRHNWTKLLQAVLNSLDYRAGPIDGVYGSVTKGAVRRFQVHEHLTVDGWVGQQTWRALKRAYC